MASGAAQNRLARMERALTEAIRLLSVCAFDAPEDLDALDMIQRADVGPVARRGGRAVNAEEAMKPCRMLVRRWAGKPLWWATLLPAAKDGRQFCVDCPPGPTARAAAKIGRAWARKLSFKARKAEAE